MYWSKSDHARRYMLGGWLGLLTAAVLMILALPFGCRSSATVYSSCASIRRCSLSAAFLRDLVLSPKFINSAEGNRERGAVPRLSLSRSKRDSAYNKACALLFGPVGRRKIRTSYPATSKCHHAGQHHYQTGDDALLLTKFIGTPPHATRRTPFFAMRAPSRIERRTARRRPPCQTRQ